MKYTNILACAAIALAGMTITSCEGEKDLIIIEGNLPIKTSTLYLVGDATPTGWSIDSPTAMAASEADPLVFDWEGNLMCGELKLCLTTGSWDAAFIRPVTAGTEIGTADIDNAEFKMHAGDPDDKWNVTAEGVYHLTFNLREWTMSTRYVSAPPAPVKDPIVTDVLYIIGEAAPCGWNIDSPTALTKVSDYVFRYEGALNSGELKACMATGSWDVSFIRPASNGLTISKTGVESPDFVFTAAPDNKWVVTDAGMYTLEFNLSEWTISATYNGEIEVDTDPIETSTLFMIGDATPGGWSMDDATEFSVDASNKYIFTWEGELVPGSFKLCLERDGTFSCPFIRPSSANVEVSKSGVAASDFVYTTNPDDQWKVVDAGRYLLTFDLEHRTVKAEFKGEGSTPEPPVTPGNPDAIETSTLFMIGDATPNGWSMDDAQEFTADTDNKYIFTWEGKLVKGTFKLCLERDGTFSCPFIRPAKANVEVTKSGVAEPGFVYTTDPDDQWKVIDEGRYRLTLDLENRTIKTEYLD